MSNVLNFTNVSAPVEKTMTKPGTIGVFKIENIEFAAASTGTEYMQVTFDNGDSSFKERFFLTEKSLGRVKALWSDVVGNELEGNVTYEQLSSGLSNKSVGLKVSGRVNAETGRGYPSLPYGGFSKPASEVGKLSFSNSQKEDIEAALKAIANSASSTPDDDTVTANEEEF